MALNQAEKQTLVVIAQGEVTLDGWPAVVSGSRHDFATVTQLRNGLQVEFAWPTVAHILAHRDGAFQS